MDRRMHCIIPNESYNINHNLAGLALGLAILEAIYFVYILLVLDYFMKELTL